MNLQSRKVAFIAVASAGIISVSCAAGIAISANATKHNSEVAKGKSIENYIEEETEAAVADIKANDAVLVGAEEEPAVTESVTEPQTEQVTQAEPSPYENKFMVTVSGEGEYLNIRAEANEDAEIVGKLYEGAGGDILEKGDAWTRVSSGGVEGYVKNDFIVTGEQAEAKAKEVGTTMAIVKEESIRIRETADENGKIYTLCGIGDAYVCQAQLDGWVQIEYDDGSAYIASDFVDVEVRVKKAVSIEEEREAALEEARAQEEAAREQAQEAYDDEEDDEADYQEAAPETVYTDSYDVSYDDAYMLACLVQAEAGGEPYDGKLATANIVINRLNSGAYGGSISDVIYAPGQFSVVRIGTFQSALSNGPSSDCVSAANEALAGVNNVPGYRSFCSVSVANYDAYNSYVVIGSQVYYN